MAIDPLADHYNKLLQSFGIDVPVVTRFGSGETLLDLFKPQSFHIVHSFNALDHAYDPVLTIKNMLTQCKPSGHVVLRGGEMLR